MKESLIQQAETLSFSTDYKNAKEQMKSLLEQWKRIPRTTREEDDRLWSLSKTASDRLYENAKRDYEERRAKQEIARNIKERIICSAESLVYSSDYKSATIEIKRLSQEFYDAGSAGKENSLSKLEDAIYRKQSQLSELLSRPQPGYNNPHRYEIAARRNERESQIRAAITDIEIKKSSLVNQILELRCKLNNSY